METLKTKFAGQLKAKGSNSSFAVLKGSDDAGCCKDFIASCEDVVTANTTTSNFINFTYEGETYTMPDGGVVVTEVEKIHEFVSKVILQNEVDPIIKVDLTDGVFTLKHIGVGVLSAAKIGVSKTASRNCTSEEVCDIEFTIKGMVENSNIVTVEHDGETVELPTGVLFNTDGDAAAETENNGTATTIKNEIEAIWGAGTVVSVVPTSTCQCYLVNAVVSNGSFASNAKVKECYTRFK